MSARTPQPRTANIEKAREALNEIAKLASTRCRQNFPALEASEWRFLSDHANRALRALDGERKASGEEWVVDGVAVHAPQMHGKLFVAHCYDEATAHRIARLPALERVVMAALTAIEDDGCPDHRTLEAAKALRAALTTTEAE